LDVTTIHSLIVLNSLKMKLVLIGASNNLNNINASIFEKLNILIPYLVTSSIDKKVNFLSKKYKTTPISYENFKNKDDYEIAYISTNENRRYEIAKQLILKGKDIILEKNFLLDQAKEKELIQLSKKNKTKIFQSLVAKYHNQFDLMAHKNYDRLGKISHINLIFFNPLKDIKNYRHSDKDNGGIINDYLNYIIEIFKKITNSEIVSFDIVKESINEYNNETTVKFFFKFSNLITSNVLISYDFFKQNLCEIICKNGSIKFYDPITFNKKTRVDLILNKNLIQKKISKLKSKYIPKYKYYNLSHIIKSNVIEFGDPIHDMFKDILNKENTAKLEFNNLDLFYKIKQN
jgi:predicted dehydrogenase